MSETGGDVISRLRFLQTLIENEESRKFIFGHDGALRFNQMTEQVECGSKTIGLEDKDLVPLRWRIAELVKRELGKAIEPSAPNLRAIIEHVADADAYHPVERWVTGLRWDNVDRLTGGLPAAFGQMPGGLEAVMLRKTLRAMVARATMPGCKVDTVLVLVGGQGRFKSTSFQALAAPWFTDQQILIDKRDSWEVCHRHWVIELGELGSLAKSELEEVKAFISKRDDTFRSAYARKSQTRQRQFILVGTTNQTEFLRDTTGNRRFWPVNVASKHIDVSWLEEHREQLVAQAAHEVAAGASWWLDKEEEQGHDEIAEAHLEVDPWEPKIQSWLGANLDVGRRGASVAEILAEACDRPVSHMHSGDARRVASVMRRLGATHHRSARERLWKWNDRCGDASQLSVSVTANH